MAIDTIKSSAVLDGAIATADIANDAVTTAKLGSVTDIASSSGAMTLSPAGTEILNVGTTGDILVKGQGSNRAALILRAGANNANSQIRLGDQAADDVGRIMYDHSDDTLRFQTAGAERFRVSASGIHIGGTGAANALDDYEEGSWTPSLGGNASYNSNVGKYTKIGNLVTVMCNIYVNTLGTGSTSQVSGLPFAVSNITEYNANGDGHVAHCAGLAQNVASITPAPMKNATTIRFFFIAAGGGNTNAANNSVFGNSTDMYFTTSYRTG